jgi:hypothetical protein
MPTSNSVLLSALEWGEVMVVKDTVTYFGRSAAGAGNTVRDLFLPDRPMVRHPAAAAAAASAEACGVRDCAIWECHEL